MDASPRQTLSRCIPRHSLRYGWRAGQLYRLRRAHVGGVGESARHRSGVAIRTAHGRRAIETVRQLRPDLNDMEELAWLERMEIADNGGLAMLAGVERILENCRKNTGLSSPPPPNARAQPHGVRRHPRAARIVSADLVTYGKPHPEPYRKGAELLGLSPRSAWSSKTRPPGESWHEAGCRVLPRFTPTHPPAWATLTGSCILSTMFRCGSPAMRWRCVSLPCRARLLLPAADTA